MKINTRFWNLMVIVALLISGLSLPLQSASAASTNIVISQVYGGGGNNGATYKNDFIELYNLGTTTVDISNWSVQYTYNTGSSWLVTEIPSGSKIYPGTYFLIQEAAGSGGTTDLPTPDVIGTILLGASNGKVALVNNSTALSSACPTGVVDFVGFGTANCFETTATPALSNTTAAIRNSNGAVDTDNNHNDFTVAAPNPRNSATVHYDPPPYVSTTTPANGSSGAALASNIAITFSEAVNAASGDFSLNCASSGNHTFGFTATDNTTFTLDPDSDFSEGELCTVTVAAANITDVDTDDPGNAMETDYSFSFTTYKLDPAPSVDSTNPSSDATDVPIADNLGVTFSEAVTLADGAVSLSCSFTGVHTAAVTTSDDITFAIDPDEDFAPSEDCTVTLDSTLITDASAQAMAEDYVWSFSTYYDPTTVLPIANARAAGAGWTGTIQGNVTVTRGVLGTYSFAIQDDTGGLYIYPYSSVSVPTLALGDVVQVRGTIANYSGLLELSPVTNVTWISSGTVPAPLTTATNLVGDTQGELIEISGIVTFGTTAPVQGTDYTFTIDDGSGPVPVFVYHMTNIDLSGFETGQPMRIIGISGNHSGAQIQPRYQSDIIDLRPPTVLSTVPDSNVADVSPHRPISAAFSKAMDPTSLNVTNFTLVKSSDSSPISGAVSYEDGTHTAAFTPAATLEPQTAYTARLTTSVTDSFGVALATDYVWSFTTGDLDNTAPTITNHVPAVGAENVAVNAPVVVTFSEDLAGGSLTTDHFVLTSPYGVVPAAISYNPADFSVTLTPNNSLLYGVQYSMKVTADTSDYAGNQLGADAVWTFTTSTEPPMQAYFGDLHNHTGYSDGSGTPTQALAAGKAAGFDFMAISDHSYSIDNTEWANTLSAVEAATDENFVALRGFEYTQGAEGHINVWNSTYHATRTDTGCTYCVYTPNLEAGEKVKGFYSWLASAENTPLDSAGEVMQFNHPGWINFNDWTYHSEVSEIARLEEVGNGSGSSYAFSEDQYIRSLDYGWKVGATSNADTHSTQWGTNTDARTGVLMPELTKSALLEALRQRRTFATEDKNASVSMLANGVWMGSEIDNTGHIIFMITGSDGDGELASLVELITDQGKVISSYQPTQSSFTWEPALDIKTGVHYYYVKVTQADGDRIVSSPVWTKGSEDIAITDVTIQPTIPTIYSPSLLTVRVTNRVAESRTVSVGLKVNDVDLGSTVEVTVPANGDGYAIFSWQPAATGSVQVDAVLTGAPEGDNTDDNTASLLLDVTDEHLPLILIDAGHGNLNAAGNDMKPFIDDLSEHHYNVLKNLDELTAADLNPQVVKLLMITAPETAYTDAELTAIANFVKDGGSLWIGGLADFVSSSNSWANTVADRENAILDRIAAVTGQTVNMRMNDDEVLDGNTNNDYVWGVYFKDFPAVGTTGIGLNVDTVSTWSLSSIVDGNKQALTVDDEGVQIVMQGDLDLGCTDDSHQNPLRTSNIDSDAGGDAYIYNPAWTCNLTERPADAVPLPGAAVVDLADGAGRIMLYGDSNDPFTMFAYTAGDGKQNELFNLQSVMWLLAEPLQKSTIAEARAQAVEDQPDHLNSLVWVEGEITAAYGEFFNVLYVEDETGGITVHAPAGDIDSTAFTRGTRVRVIGTIGIYNGDTEIEFFEPEMVQVLEASSGEPAPASLTTAQAALEANEGRLITVSGRVTQKTGSDTIYVDDGSGPVRVFLDGYNGAFADIRVNSYVRVVGLASEDGDGQRIRVRNYKMHPEYTDDVTVTGATLYLPVVSNNP